MESFMPQTRKPLFASEQKANQDPEEPLPRRLAVFWQDGSGPRSE